MISILIHLAKVNLELQQTGHSPSMREKINSG